jgi:4-amino-4-deoxychorismate lyase
VTALAVRILRGGSAVDALSADDRGLNYGDGLFETILIHAGAPVWWDEHWQRLCRGAQRLGIAPPAPAVICAEVEALAAGHARAVLKLVLTRGAGGRGYAPSAQAEPTCILSVHPAPAPVTTPIQVRWCALPLAIQPALAGIKHLNRLEQVLARSEWQDPGIAEGLMCDTAGRVVCATAANLFVFIDGVWRTPSIERCGVAGIARDWLLANVPGIEVTVLGPETVESAQAVFLCNAVRGILPVGRLGAREWRADARTTQLRRRLADAQPAFAFEE